MNWIEKLMPYRLLIEVAAVIVFAVAYTLYVHHAGAAGCLNNDALAAAHQETAIATKTALAVQTIQTEAKVYAEAKLVPVPVTVPRVTCVRDAPGEVLPPAAAGSFDHGGPGLSTGVDRHLSASADVATPAITIGRDANAQVRALKAYIREVCLAP